MLSVADLVNNGLVGKKELVKILGRGEVTMKLRSALVDIQTGKSPDTHNWLHRIL